LVAFFFFFAVFFRALGRAFLAAFFFFFLAFGLEEERDSSIGIEGLGAGVGDEGNIGSMNPGPGQLLSV
jgi:hypothetical protein